jgi:hypothetical protein
MMADKIHEFANRYGIRNIRVSREYDRMNYDYSTTKYSYYDREETLEVEIPRSSFDNLVNVDSDFTRIWQDQRDEAYMRKQYPAIAEAYSKYRMLLELYK